MKHGQTIRRLAEIAFLFMKARGGLESARERSAPQMTVEAGGRRGRNFSR